jgi:DNA (cytosine-5)-methyltransferase 1
MMLAGSLFAGIGGFDVAFQRCGIRTVWAAEQDPKCNSVRRRHFPDEETVTDVADVSGVRFRADILAGGFPCQDISVAGKRAGLAGSRSGLWGEFARIIGEQAPRWVLIENVGGLLSSNGTRDLGTILGTLGELGYGFAYRIFDAQWWGVPQRRRRIFIVGCLGDWRRAAEVLFEPESLPWDSPPSREAGASITPILEVGARTGGKPGEMQRDGLGIGTPGDPMFTLQAGKQHGIAHTLRAEGFDASEDGTGRGTPLVPVAFDCKQSGESGEVSPPLRALCHDKSHANGGGQVAVAFAQNTRDEVRELGGNIAGALPAQPGMKQQTYLKQGMAVRRLMPIECEKLQGFPPDWTQYGEHGEEIADGPRYRMLGNAVAVPVVEWIGKRILTANSYLDTKG